MSVAMRAVFMSQVAQPLPEQVHANAKNGQSRNEPNPGVNALGHDRVREKQNHYPKKEDANRVRERHDCAEKHRVPRGSLCSNKEGSDDSFAVTGRKRM